MRKFTAEDFAHLDIPSEVEKYTSTRLNAKNTQYEGACPYEDCLGDHNGFMVWDQLSNRNCHFYCRNCRRAGTIIKLIQDIKQLPQHEVCQLLDIDKGKDPLDINELRAWRRRKQLEVAEKQKALLASVAARTGRLKHERAQAYLQQRGIHLDIAMQYGLFYIPALKEMSDELKAAWWDMRQWTDRLIFPLSDGGFTGRALFLWSPGMDENEHKHLLDRFNARVTAHNKAHAYKDRKEPIPRWYTTMTDGYFHGEALRVGEHVTVVEGPFDALACLAAGIDDVIAAGTNGINGNHIPIQICFATIAFDGDRGGKGGSANTEKTFRRKGIKTERCIPPDDDMGEDWSERYRRAGVDGLAPLLIHDDTIRCEDCQTPIEETEDFFFDTDGKGHCTKCRVKPDDGNGIDVEPESVATSEESTDKEPDDVTAIALVDGGIPVYQISDDEFMKRAQQEMLAKLAQDNEEQERQVRETRQAKRERGYAKLRGQLVAK